MVSSIQFQLTSELNATTPAFTLTCTSTGGPATTVSWRRDDEILTDNITSQVLIDATTATYTHTLTVTGRLVGEYECNVSNNKPSSSSGMLAVVGKKYKYTFESIFRGSSVFLYSHTHLIAYCILSVYTHVSFT